MSIQAFFVNDGSTYESCLLLQEVLHGTTLRQPKLDKGAAINAQLKSIETSHVAFLDIDLGLYPANSIEFWRPIQKGKAMVILGYRQIPSQSSYIFRYKIGNQILSYSHELEFNQVITDVMCNFNIFSN